MRITIALLTLLAAMCLPLGWVLPLLQLERLFFFTDTPSLIGLVSGLWGSADYGLAIIIAIVSFAFPVAKLVALAAMVTTPTDEDDAVHRIGKWLATFSKWSMLDVVLVALAIFAAKTTGLATAISQPGIWFFAASVIVSTIAAGLPTRLSVQEKSLGGDYTSGQ
ncbi:MAG: paraquat-inducible protein A [Pseudomonadota bacterium]